MNNIFIEQNTDLFKILYQQLIIQHQESSISETLVYNNEPSNFGVLYCKAKLRSLREDKLINVPIGVSIIPSLNTINYAPYLMENDIEICYRQIIDEADYVVINLIGSTSINPHYQNISINNKEFIKNLFQRLNEIQIIQKQHLSHQIRKIINLKQSTLRQEQESKTKNFPIMAKIMSDLDADRLNHLLSQNIDGVILQKSSQQSESEYLELIRNIAQRGKTVISVGGVNETDQIKSRIQHGASGVQIYSLFLQKGPTIMKQLVKQLS